jgi:hypothetical protein
MFLSSCKWKIFGKERYSNTTKNCGTGWQKEMKCVALACRFRHVLKTPSAMNMEPDFDNISIHRIDVFCYIMVTVLSNKRLEKSRKWFA